VKLSFHGAAEGVTGSCHLLTCGGRRILVDCGFFQGKRHADEDNAGDFGFDPASVDILLLTHAHLDHCGRIPLLVKRGFQGEIITTAPTRDLAKLVLLDSANIQEEDAEHASRRMRRQGREPIAPLFDVTDTLRALDFFGRIAAYDAPIDLGDGVTARFINAGHILGSASIVLDLTEGDLSRRIVFSGDLGNAGRPVLPDPSPPPEADYVVMESTYGDRPHRSFDASVAELLDAVRQTLARGGNVVIPTFALERAQEILFFLSEGVENGELPASLPVFLDSPMAVSATEIFRRYPDAFKPDFRESISSGKDPFQLPQLRFTRRVSESMEINRIKGGAVIMAGSGMCTGGRVRHHLKHNIWRAESSVVFVGFAAAGTLGRRIVDGAKEVRLFGEEIAVRARIHTINGFSAHADQGELLAWHGHAGTPRTTFLVHGDADSGMAAMAKILTKRNLGARCPSLHEEVTLT
jgi:metallo-beta-lactamase family protein